VSGGHAHGLYVHSGSRIHALPPQCKVAATFLFVVAVVATPRHAIWAFGLYLLLLVIVARIARVSAAFVLRRLMIEVPFLLFAAFLPFIAGGPQLELLGIPVSIEGLWGAFNIASKATLGAMATILLAATTPVADILFGLERLHTPRVFVAIAHFMVRYGDVVSGEARRMKVARESRGSDPRWMWHARAIAASIASLFIRSFERGERVYLAMLSRGYAGTIPLAGRPAPVAVEWAAALLLPAAAVAIALGAWAVT
jgi:cobalt/nickel transport system permease protein